jgi:hypothetical protein
MDTSNSILDKVISSKKITEIEQFNPTEVVSQLLKNLTGREEDVLRRRHGLLGKEAETLEKIGETYRVTRERIRQIEKTAINKINKSKNFSEVINLVERTVFSVLEQNGGIMAEESMLKKLLYVVGDNYTNRQNILFIISELLNNKFRSIKSDDEFRKSWQIMHAPLHLFREIDKLLFNIISENKKPIIVSDIIQKLKDTDFFQKNSERLNDDTIISYLEINPKISKNPFDEYGLSEWGSIVPKRMNDKIYLILKKYGKPMHFNEITKKINEIQFDKRRAYPPTVHNELILNDKYVLVGRGIYALKEWGYHPGVVANVIKQILKGENHPLSRDELIKRVLKQRIVKKNTICLALTNRTKFKKLSDGSYTLAEKEK